MFLAAEHFVRAPDWTWFILGYFFLAGLSGGSYVIATLLRLSGDPRDEPAARLGFYTSFLLIPLCPVFLTADLGASWWKFWHMLVNVTPGNDGLNFKYWSPMSVGVWLLELILLVAFFVTLVNAGTGARTIATAPLWLLALVGLAASLVGLRSEGRRMRPSGGGGAGTAVASVGANALLVSVLVLIGVLALRAAVIFSGQ